jgi:exodeoxyribonuclease VIII
VRDSLPGAGDGASGGAAVTLTDYDAIEAINFSSLKHMAVSPMLYRWRQEHPEPTKAAYAFGGAVHCAVLEPDLFDQRYAVFDGIRKGGAWAEWQVEHDGMTSLRSTELAAIRAIVESVQRHRIAASLLRGGRREEAIVWIDEETGLACKGRVDYIRPSGVIEFKSTRDPHPSRFTRDLINYGYDAQAAFYHDGATRGRVIPGSELPYFIAAQTREPYDVAVYQLQPESLAGGRRFYRSLLKRLALCMDSDFWPGVAPDLVPIEHSPWADNRNLNTEESEDF